MASGRVLKTVSTFNSSLHPDFSAPLLLIGLNFFKQGGYTLTCKQLITQR
jgi:hypothetical protein